jgi:two-component system, NtrC family, sensor kinase
MDRSRRSHAPAAPVADRPARDLLRRTIIRLVLTYLAPFVLLTLYFHLQSSQLLTESRCIHLRSIAEHQSNTLDLFLRERVANLSNLIYSPRLHFPPSEDEMHDLLSDLRRSSDTFVDVGFFDASGVQLTYAGPFASLVSRDYSRERWYEALRDNSGDFVITDSYLGFRGRPHFTIGVKRLVNGRVVVLRATLDPEKLLQRIVSDEDAGEVYTSVVNREGYYQLVTPALGNVLDAARLVPASSPRLGLERGNSRQPPYGYAWLRAADWAVTVQWADQAEGRVLPGFDVRVALVSFGAILVIFVVILVRAQKLVQMRHETDQTRAQLEHAAKLASVGELAAGIAHEINNPLAIISEEAGLMGDLMDPQFGQTTSPPELGEHIKSIHEAVFRCRDITNKLLRFVRKADIQLEPYGLNKLVEAVLDGFFKHEMAVSNIEIVRRLEPDLPLVVTDRHQLEQVILNIINNAVDAIGDQPGRITIVTFRRDDNINISVTDTGKGIPPEYLDRIFLPFFTTKEVGKGTGLGLSVSYGIVKNLGGRIFVESEPGRGATFTVELPLR